eukprot:CAMPEP_0201535998 /NCGR_PEP_ID=MMETSP0161_2-20130828/60674_1 /ASSEMBLY_ACC=CAM_ASM_000251 /TAXON_ID=180227 /ORGANISM="Neoparamoeba aestuarina, Strain SoJaBio B1-5/56/2" /LENGTH=109 /DNA_ID=CAMNT_0047941459 /DNA_START=360 /DNA_END=685 /DNA_ORIENTATION=-
MTEVGYYLQKDGKNRLAMDMSADRYSGKKLAGLNPRGLVIQEGIAYETPETFQHSTKEHKSGDGTVPYCSLSYAERVWSDSVHVYAIEIEEAEHREMLNNEAVLNALLA